jgi:hypothetical protein
MKGRAFMNKNSTVSELVASKSLEEIEEDLKIKRPKHHILSRLGYPRSKYYKLFTRRQVEENRKKADSFLNSID